MSRTNTSRAAAAAVVLLAALLSACAGQRPCVDPSLTPAQQAHQAEIARLREVQRAAEFTKRVGELVLSLSQAEVDLASMGRIDREHHVAAQTYFDLAADVVLVSLENAKDMTKPADLRRDGIAAALRLIDGLKASIVDKLPNGDARMQLGLIVATIQTLLVTWQIAS